MGILDGLELQVLNQRTDRYAEAKHAMTTRTDDRKAEQAADRKAEAAFLAKVRTRDEWRCRCCGRKVKKTLEHDPLRAEVHHLHGRVGDLRFEERAALVLCLQDHERVTGTVGKAKLVAVGTKFFLVGKQRCIDATKTVRFKVAA